MKEELLKLIEEIKIAKGYTQGQISEMAGYDANYLAVCISKNQVSRKLLHNVQRLLLHENSIHVKDATVLSLEMQLEMVAANRVILSVLAEVQASVQNRLPVDLANTYRRMVKDEAEQLRQELHKK